TARVAGDLKSGGTARRPRPGCTEGAQDVSSPKRTSLHEPDPLDEGPQIRTHGRCPMSTRWTPDAVLKPPFHASGVRVRSPPRAPGRGRTRAGGNHGAPAWGTRASDDPARQPRF